MRRIFLVCAALAALSLVASHQVQAQNASSVKGTFAFTLAESCVQQNSFSSPGFDSNFRITDPNGAMTYGGASNGEMIFDGKGGVSVVNAAATNIFNASGFLQPRSIPLGFGFGPALPFSCTGHYSVDNDGNITAGLTCTASIDPKNPGNPLDLHDGTGPRVITGFQSQFNMEGVMPQNSFHLLLTDLGKPPVQTVDIFNYKAGTNPPQALPDLIANRVCTRSTTLVRISP
jgi:hypothetical protein